MDTERTQTHSTHREIREKDSFFFGRLKPKHILSDLDSAHKIFANMSHNDVTTPLMAESPTSTPGRKKAATRGAAKESTPTTSSTTGLSEEGLRELREKNEQLSKALKEVNSSHQKAIKAREKEIDRIEKQWEKRFSRLEATLKQDMAERDKQWHKRWEQREKEYNKALKATDTQHQKELKELEKERKKEREALARGPPLPIGAPLDPPTHFPLAPPPVSAPHQALEAVAAAAAAAAQASGHMITNLVSVAENPVSTAQLNTLPSVLPQHQHQHPHDAAYGTVQQAVSAEYMHPQHPNPLPLVNVTPRTQRKKVILKYICNFVLIDLRLSVVLCFIPPFFFFMSMEVLCTLAQQSTFFFTFRFYPLYTCRIYIVW